MLILLKILGDYCIGEPPLTIPNREVKPNCADGTAFSGRVGRRLSYLIPSGFPDGIFFYLVFVFRQGPWPAQISILVTTYLKSG